MKKRLSTSLTFFWKFVIPSVFFSFFGISFLMMVTKISVGMIFLVIPFLFCLLIYFQLGKLKRVHIDDDFLYVNNFRQSIKIPLKEISGIYENIFFDPRIITVEFKNETEFGRSIKFAAYTRLFLFFTSHPVINEIKSRKNYPSVEEIFY